MFDTLLPEAVSVVQAKDWMWSTPASQEEEVHIQRAVEKRRREFRAGRHAAKAALAALNIHRYDLLPGKGREPLWPAGIVGAITHTGNLCVAAVARSSDAMAVGIDAEQNDPLKNELKSMICTARELEWVDEQERRGNTWASKLIFSAKESIHKIYYPLNFYTLDFLDAELTLDLDQHSFRGRILKPNARPHVSILDVQGRFCVDAQHVYTAIFLEQGTL